VFIIVVLYLFKTQSGNFWMHLRVFVLSTEVCSCCYIVQLGEHFIFKIP